MDARLRERYSRQILFGPIGEEGQELLRHSTAAIIGCGAVGAALASLLVRAGIGRLRIVDRDFVEPSNLQRQTLFEEADARDSMPKSIAAERRLRAVNSDVAIDALVGDLNSANARELLSGFQLILDGTDNFETRLLINDASIALGVPWIYAAAVASYGITLTVLPGQTPCLACLLEPSRKSNGPSSGFGLEDTCDTVGVLNSAASAIASIQAAEATKLLTGKSEALNGHLVSCDVWTGRFQSIRVAKNPQCRACVRREFAYLEGQAQPHVTMCGRDSVQIHERTRHLDLDELGQRIGKTVTEVRRNDFLLRFRVSSYELTVFPDGRAVIKGTHDPAVARSLYSRYIGA